MFLSSALSGAGLNHINPDQEREPPLEPTPVTFPTHELREGRTWDDETLPPNFRSIFSQVLKPADISEKHIEALNIDILPTCLVDDLVPLAADGSSHFPSVECDTQNSVVHHEQNEPEADRIQKLLTDRLPELRVDNDLAFRTVTRCVAPGVQLPRLAFFRRFWEGLETMSQYWDCSLDQYYEKDEIDDEREKCAKRQRLETESSMANGTRPDTQSSTPNDILRNDETPESSKHTPENSTPEPHPSRRYKGRRTSNGRQMPDQFRMDTVRAFVEGAAWPFNCSLLAPRVMPIVQFDGLNLPVRQSAAVYRVPKERSKGRQGFVEGPMMGLQARPELDFCSEDGTPDEVKGRLDMMRELGCLLQLAQERRRQGQTEMKPGEGKWWTTTQRWGGGPGGEMETSTDPNEITHSEVMEFAEHQLNKVRERDPALKGIPKPGRAAKDRKRKNPAILWKELKPGRGYWDPKIDYSAIGKDQNSEYDEIFLVSALNHHISIVKMTIHASYVEYLISKTLPDSYPSDSEWCRPKIRRSPWFDLFDMDQRLDAFRGLWGVMAYLTREPEPIPDEGADAHLSSR